MKYRKQIRYSEEQKSQMWDRWQKGESLHSIARLFDRGHSSISRIISITGGIRPPKRRRSRLALSLSEREDISRSIATGSSMRMIAAQLGRSTSTINREINRNGGFIELIKKGVLIRISRIANTLSEHCLFLYQQRFFTSLRNYVPVF